MKPYQIIINKYGWSIHLLFDFLIENERIERTNLYFVDLKDFIISQKAIVLDSSSSLKSLISLNFKITKIHDAKENDYISFLIYAKERKFTRFIVRDFKLQPPRMI